MSREQDAIIAEWCEPRNLLDLPGPGYYDSPLGFWTCIVSRDGGVDWVKPQFSTDLDAMARALAVVKERGHEIAYAWALAEVLGIWQSPLDWYPAFLLITATAAQRAEALCRVIETEAAAMPQLEAER